MRRKAVEPIGILRNRLEAMPNKSIAAEAQIDASHVGKVLAGAGALTLPALGRLLELAELKLVDKSRVCVMASEIQLLRKVYARVVDQAPWLMDQGDA